MCRSSGAETCRITGRPADQWDHLELDLHYFNPDVSAARVRRSYAPVVSDVGRRPHSAAHAQGPEPDAVAAASELIGISSSFSAAGHLIERVAPTQATVLFTGASGVGKELLAQTLRDIGLRAAAPFVAIN